MNILLNLLTVDSDRANLPLHGGILDFLVQSNEPKSAFKSTVLFNNHSFVGSHIADVLLMCEFDLVRLI